jgi:hypothetical protein
VTVFGPQVSYFSPQILVEMDIHAPAKDGRPGIDARGTAFPGVNLYVQLGRGRDYAWSATSAGQDIVDTFAVDLCEPDGRHPDEGVHALPLPGRVPAFEVLERQNQYPRQRGGSDPDRPEAAHRALEARPRRRPRAGRRAPTPTRCCARPTCTRPTRHSVLGLQRPAKLENAEEFQRAAHRIGFTFNWFYADDRDIAYFNSASTRCATRGPIANFPVRACPTAACEFEWAQLRPRAGCSATHAVRGASRRRSTRRTCRAGTTSPAPEYRAADDNYTWQSVHRSSRWTTASVR